MIALRRVESRSTFATIRHFTRYRLLLSSSPFLFSHFPPFFPRVGRSERRETRPRQIETTRAYYGNSGPLFRSEPRPRFETHTADTRDVHGMKIPPAILSIPSLRGGFPKSIHGTLLKKRFSRTRRKDRRTKRETSQRRTGVKFDSSGDYSRRERESGREI